MPIRGLIYFAKLYEAYIKKQELNLYQKTLVKLQAHPLTKLDFFTL